VAYTIPKAAKARLDQVVAEFEALET